MASTTSPPSSSRACARPSPRSRPTRSADELDDEPEPPEGRDTPAQAAERAAREARARRARIEQQQTWVDLQIRRARERCDFDDLPGLGKPLGDLGDAHDPDWWVKRLVEREHIVVVPPALQLRRDDAALDDLLDRLGSEAEVRREVGEFNERVRRVLYSTHGGPPVTTARRDVEEEVRRWSARRDERRARRSAAAAADRPGDRTPRRRTWRRWFRVKGASGPTVG